MKLLGCLGAACVAAAVLSPDAQAQLQFSSRAPSHSWIPRVAAGGGGFLVNTYQYDDGTSENSIGVTGGTLSTGIMCWMSRLDAVGGADTISSISVAYGTALFPGGAPPNGTLATVAVWEDPNDDGNLTDGVLLTQQATTVQNVDTDILNVVAITPVSVSGTFFVGAFCPSLMGPAAQSEFPASLDLASPSSGRTWAVAQNPSTGFNPANIGDPTYTIPLTDMGTVGAGFNGVWLLRAEGTASTPVSYCTAKLASIGCSPTIGFSGVSSASAGSGFFINGTDFINNKNCLLFYGTSGQSAGAFQGGFLCVKTPIRRTPSTNTFGNPPPNDCTGVPALDFNLFAVGGLGGTPLPALTVPGTTVNAQWWGRDPGFIAPNNTQLSNGLEFVVNP